MSHSNKIMEQIWEKMDKPDGKNIIFKDADVTYLYYSGFVDEKKHSFEDWQKAFKKFKQKNNLFKISKTDFLSLSPYRYDGPVNEPFDALKITPGPWTKEQLTKLFKESIQPSSRINAKTFWRYIEKCKEKGLQDKEGNLIMTMEVKVGFKEFLEQFPSNLRSLEKNILKTRLIKQKGKS